MSISNQLIEKGYAKSYDGGTKNKWVDSETLDDTTVKQSF